MYYLQINSWRDVNSGNQEVVRLYFRSYDYIGGALGKISTKYYIITVILRSTNILESHPITSLPQSFILIVPVEPALSLLSSSWAQCWVLGSQASTSSNELWSKCSWMLCIDRRQQISLVDDNINIYPHRSHLREKEILLCGEAALARQGFNAN